MLICTECGETFGELEAVTVREYVCKVGMEKAYEYFSTCPKCGGYYLEEAKQCAICGKFTEKDLLDYNDVCQECFEEALSEKNLIKACGELAREDEEVNKFALNFLGLELVNNLVESFLNTYRHVSPYVIKAWVSHPSNEDVRDKLSEMIKEERL